MINWEIGIDIYTLICIKWITNKNLLYKNKTKQKQKKPTNIYGAPTMCQALLQPLRNSNEQNGYKSLLT